MNTDHLYIARRTRLMTKKLARAIDGAAAHANCHHEACTAAPTSYAVGDKVTNARAFTTPIGCWFRAGSTFTVVLGGTTAGRSIKLSADQCGSVVWISDGLFLTSEAA